jgi:hypothetical protein
MESEKSFFDMSFIFGTTFVSLCRLAPRLWVRASLARQASFSVSVPPEGTDRLSWTRSVLVDDDVGASPAIVESGAAALASTISPAQTRNSGGPWPGRHSALRPSQHSTLDSRADQHASRQEHRPSPSSYCVPRHNDAINPSQLGGQLQVTSTARPAKQEK